jgi:hypothetical protein
MVAERIEAAFRAIEFSERRVGPKGFVSWMPAPVRSFEDKVERRLEDWIEDVLHSADRAVSREELERADEALEWIRMLKLDPLEGDEALMRDAVVVVSLGRATKRYPVDALLARRRNAADRMLAERADEITAANADEAAAVKLLRDRLKAKIAEWAATAKAKPVREELLDEALKRKRKKLRASGWVKAKATARTCALTAVELDGVRKARDRAIDKSALMLERRELAEFKRRHGFKRIGRSDVMPGKSFNSRQLYDWFHRGCGEIAARLSHGRLS